jgi:hypothetical protein
LTKSSEGVVVETGGPDDCPIGFVKEYLKHTHPLCDFLWQRPLQQYRPTDDKWFGNSKLGHNTMTAMMKNISKFLFLSKLYTNHCVRATTAITILGKSFQDNDIAAVSGHKTLQALGIYKRTSVDTLVTMSEALHASMTKRKCDDAVQGNSPTKEVPAVEDSLTNATTNHAPTVFSTDDATTREVPAVVVSVTNATTINAPATFSASNNGADQQYNGIAKLCAENDSRVFSHFAPLIQNCSNITFNFNFHK